MRARLLTISVLLLALAAGLPSVARATGFADTPCPEAGPGGVRVCPAALVGRSYAIRLAGNGGCGPALPYQYRILNGGLPPGLSLSSDGVISGTPTSGGGWRFWVELSDQDPPSASWCAPKKSEREFSIGVGVPSATVGAPYSFTLGDGAGAKTWSLVSGALPSGVTLDAVAGVVSGTPEQPGSFPLVFSAIDAGGVTTRLDFTLTVYPRLAFATVRLPTARVGRPLHASFRTSGAVGPVTLEVVSGRFPTGVRLVGALGVLRGRPRKAGVYRFTLRAQDLLGRVATRSFALRVSPAA